MDVQVAMPPPPPPPPPPPAFFAETTTQLTTPPPPPPPPQSVTTTSTTVTTVSVTSPPTQDRIWLHPWTATEMRDNASQWSLAGDAGVLLYLEQFSDRLTQRADAINQHLAQTVNAVKSTHTRVLNCLNEFTSLANTQFIENRVYDEDETADSVAGVSKKDEQSTEKSNVNSTEAQEKVLQRYVEAIQYGLTILDTHFERVEAKLDNNANGGFEDEEDAGVPVEPILEPKDPYIFRPLPHLIGTTEFMEDDYVGLGDLLILPDGDTYDVEQIEKLASDSALASSDEEDDREDDKEDDQEFAAQMSPAPIVPAGVSRPDLSNRAPPPATKSVFADSEDEDDPFGIGNNITKLDSNSSKPTVKDEDFFDDEPQKPPPPQKFSEKAFTLDSDEDEDNSTFGLPKKPTPTITEKNIDNDFDDKSSTSSKASEDAEPEPPKPKMLSELEKAVLKRRGKIDPDAIPDNNNNDDDDDDGFAEKPTPKKATTTSNKPSSSTISQTLTKPAQTSKPSIFGDDEDEDGYDIFNPKPKISTVTTLPTTKLETKPSQKKEKDMFDEDSDDDADIFSPKAKPPTASLTSTKKNDSIATPQSIVPIKPISRIKVDVSDDDEMFGEKPTPIVTKPAVVKKEKSSDSDDDMFTAPVSKPPPPSTKKTTTATTSDDEDPPSTSKPPPPPSTKKTTTTIISDDDDPLFISKPPPPPSTKKTTTAIISDDDDPLSITKPPTQKVTPSPASVILPPVRKTQPKSDDDSDDSSDDDSDEAMFGPPKSKKPPPPTSSSSTTTSASKVVPSVKHDDEDEDDLFGNTTTKPKVLPTVKLPSPVVLPPLSPASGTKSNVYDDPLRIGKSVESTPPPSAATVVQPTKTASIPIKNSFSSHDEEENSPPKRELNTGALKEGEKISVKDMKSRLNFNPGAFKPGGMKPGGARPKTNSITEESHKPSIEDDDQPIEKNEPAPSIVKKIPKIDFDSDEDDLFNDKKKNETPKASVVEQKEKTINENENKKPSIKELSSRIGFNPMLPGAQPKPTAKETNNNAQTASNEEPTADKTMINILRDRAKVGGRNRAPPSRKPRTAAASTNDNDDLFATPKTTNSTTPSPAPTITPTKPLSAPTTVPVVPSSVPANVPVVPPPSVDVPVTGLPDKSAAIAAKKTNFKEKKKFSLFDSDDSDIDELLFGSSTKKTKSPAASKTTTTTTTSKPTTKASILPLDDDDDFLSKRPVKKNTKPIVDGDDIFADVKNKGEPVNKAKKDWSIMNKTDETNDIFNDASTKSSNASKSKPANVKAKSTKSFDDIFNDPLNVSSKR